MKARDSLNKYKSRLFHGPWFKPVGEHMCRAIWDAEQSLFWHVLLIFQRCKSYANEQDIEIKLNLTWNVKVNQLQKQ